MKKPLVTLMLILGMTTLNLAPAQASGGLWEHKMGEVINSYLKIRSQLASDSLGGIKDEGRKIAEAAKAIQNIIDNSSHDHKLHQFHSQVDLQALGKHTQMLHGRDIKAVRKHFKLLSEPVRKYVELFGKPENVRGELYVYQCTMYPGSWLQEDKNIGNPYYGKKMLKCGSLAGKSADEGCKCCRKKKGREHKHHNM